MVKHMASLGHESPGPCAADLPRVLVKPQFSELCRSLGIEPGKTWVLEVSNEGILQFTRPLTEAERSRYVPESKSRREPSSKPRKGLRCARPRDNS